MNIVSLFTFQSGDIQIDNIKIIVIYISVIYIPIWWYSNMVENINAISRQNNLHSNLVIFKCVYQNGVKKFEKSFTFQSGDIQMYILCVVLSTSWALFTFQSGDIQIDFINKTLLFCLLIYIPIWWYSNFHLVYPFYHRFAYLHSNLVIFK